jgi:hypothetical protein
MGVPQNPDRAQRLRNMSEGPPKPPPAEEPGPATGSKPSPPNRIGEALECLVVGDNGADRCRPLA